MKTPGTIRLSLGAQNALAEIAGYLDGETTEEGLSVRLTPARLVELALLELEHSAERAPEQVMNSLVRVALND